MNTERAAVEHWQDGVRGLMLGLDAPAAGGGPVWLLVGATVAYGPLYLLALLSSWWLRRRGRPAAALKAWLALCGGGLAFWGLALALNLIFCGGTAVCR